MVIREGDLPRHHAAGAADGREEFLGIRDAGNRKRRTARHITKPPLGAKQSSVRCNRRQIGIRHRVSSGRNRSKIDDRVCGRDGVDRLSQPACWQRTRVGQILGGDDDEICVAVQIEVLKTIVEHVHGAAEMMLGQAAREVPAARRKDGHTGETARKHQRFVSRAIQIRTDTGRIADDDDAVGGVAPCVAAAQDRRMFTHRAQAFGHQTGQWSLGTSAGRKIADADHGT